MFLEKVTINSWTPVFISGTLVGSVLLIILAICVCLLCPMLPMYCTFGFLKSLFILLATYTPIIMLGFKLEAQWAEPVSLTFHSVLIKFYTEPSIDASYQISVHLAIRFQRRRYFFRNQPIRNKNCLWWPCMLMDQYEISNLYRGPSIDASYQVAIHLVTRFQRRLF